MKCYHCGKETSERICVHCNADQSCNLEYYPTFTRSIHVKACCFTPATLSAVPQDKDFRIEDHVLIEYIGSDAVVTVPDGVCTIGKRAFVKNTSIQSVTLPSSVTEINEEAFDGCIALKSINFPVNLKRIENLAFSKSGLCGKVILPLGLSELGRGAFYRTSIEEASIPGTVHSVPGNAFNRCIFLKKITFCKGVKAITSPLGDRPFDGCSALTTLVIPDSLIAIGRRSPEPSILSGAENLKEIIASKEWQNAHPEFARYLPGKAVFKTPEQKTTLPVTATSEVKASVPTKENKPEAKPTDGTNKRKESPAVAQHGPEFKVTGRSLTKYSGTDAVVTVPDGIRIIGKDAFSYNRSLQSVILPQSIIKIKENAFHFCSKLKSINFPDGLEIIEENAFSYTGLTGSLVLPDSLKELGATAFESTLVDDVVIPGGVSQFPGSAFYDCKQLKKVTLRDGVERITSTQYYTPFKNCNALATLVIPDSLEDIEKGNSEARILSGAPNIKTIIASDNWKKAHPDYIAQLLPGSTNAPKMASAPSIESASAVTKPAMQQPTADELYQQGKRWEQNEDLKRAFDAYLKAANLNHAPSQNQVGKILRDGLGVEKDEKAAFSWFIKSAQQGNARGEFYVGRCYEHGDGVQQDYNQARSWYERSARKGDPWAQINLGQLYEHGDGVEKDDYKAFQLYSQSAEQSDALAMANLGRMLLYGRGTAKNEAKAFEWFTLSAAQMEPYGIYLAAQCLKQGRGTSKDPAAALKLFLLAAEKGDVDAQFEVGQCYDSGSGTQKDQKKAFEWYLRAAEQGHHKAQSEVGSAYYFGEVVPENNDEAIRWLKSGIQDGSLLSLNILIYCLMEKNSLPDKYLTLLSKDFSTKVKKARNIYGSFLKEEHPILLRDDTLFGSMKKGFVLTTKTLYCSSNNKIVHCPLKEIKGVDTMESVPSYLRIGFIELIVTPGYGNFGVDRILVGTEDDQRLCEMTRSFWKELLECLPR